MAVFFFHIDVDAPPHLVTERLRSVVREKGEFGKGLGEMSRREPPVISPFAGSVEEGSFKIRRDIGYQNSFLPLIYGRIVPIPTGTRVSVTMFLHPLVVVFVVVGLGSLGVRGLVGRSASHGALWGMLAFLIALTAGGFFPEAIKAKRLLAEAVSQTSKF